MMKNRGCRALRWLLVMLCLGLSTSLAWSSPGDERWSYSSEGGTWVTEVVLNKNGDRIMVTTKGENSGGTYIPTGKIACVDKNGNIKWEKSISNTALSAGIAIDSNDNLIAAGWTSKDSKPVWHVESFKAEDGSPNWSKDIDVGNTTGIGFGIFAFVNDVAVDSAGNILVGGAWVKSGKFLGYLLSLSPEGNKNWDVSLSPHANPSYIQTIAIDPDDNVIVGASIPGSDSKGDWYIGSFSSSGENNWGTTLTQEGGDYIEKVISDSKGNVIAMGKWGDRWRVSYFDSSGTPLWDAYLNDSIAYDAVVDSKGNVVVAGKKSESTSEMMVVSYSPSGGENWKDSYDGANHKGASGQAIALGKDDAVCVAGDEVFDNTTRFRDWLVRCYSSSGTLLWSGLYDSGVNKSDAATDIVIDPATGDVVVAGIEKANTYGRMIDYQGFTPFLPVKGHVLVVGEVNSFQPAVETPDPDNGKYLGFGDVVANGTHFKVEAAFPQYLKESDNSTLAVKIFIAAQMPDDYSRLAYFDSSNNLKYQPPERLSSWKSSVNGEVAKTTIFPEVDVSSAFSNIPSGTHYWYTLVVPATVPDDFSGVDWATTPWEITVNIFDVR